MAQVTFNAVNEGDALNAATWNTLFTNLSTASTSVDTDNIRQEGIDKRNVKISAVLTNHLSNNNTSPRAISYGIKDGMAPDPEIDLAPIGTWIQALYGDPVANTPYRVGQFSLNPATQFSIIKASLEIRKYYESDSSAGPPAIHRKYGFSLYQSIGGVVSMVPGSEWYLENDSSNLIQLSNKASPTWCMALAPAASVVYDWIEIRVTANAPDLPHTLTYLYLSEGSIQVSVWDR